jgi:intein/homing endonuclease
MATDEFKELKQRSLFSKLKRLFSSDAIVRNVGGKKLKVIDTDEISYASDRNTMRGRFDRIRTGAANQYSRDFTLSYQASRIELFRDYDCVGPDTVIPLPDGSRPTIAELSEKYKNTPNERFFVFSYDHESDSVKLGLAYNPRKKEGGARKAWKIIFDNGQYVVGSAGHPFLMRNGEYKKLEDLSIGESVMPFYQKDFYKNGYRSIYNFSKGWQSEHVIVAEQFDRQLKENEVVHHKNFNKSDNLPSNLKIMADADHRAFHMYLNNKIIWSPENKENTLKKIKSSIGYKNRKCHKWNGERAGKNNPFYGKSHSDKSKLLLSNSLKVAFLKRNQTGEKNPKFRDDLSLCNIKTKAIEYYKNTGKLNIWKLCKSLNCDYSTVTSRLNANQYNWESFKQEITSTLNHKIVAIEYIGEIDVYDVTVEKYQNFATDSCFVHNTMSMDPIINSAIEIYADECLTDNELGVMLTIKSGNDNIKQILQNLFYDILNIEFNLWSWTRNLVKYGDFYLKLHISPEYGVYMVEPLSSYSVTRVENSNMENKNYVKYHVNLPEGGKIEELESYQVAHFRLLGDSNFLPYGTGILEGARRVWKQLCLHENAEVWTNMGSKKIKDIEIGETVYSFDPSTGKTVTTKVKNKAYTGNRNVYKISTCHRDLLATIEHPVLTTTGYKNVGDLTVNDYLILPTTENINGFFPKLTIDLPTDVDRKLIIVSEDVLKNNFSEFVRFFGFMLGDGWLDKSNNTVCFCLGDRLDKSEKYIKFIEKLGVNYRLTNGTKSDSNCIVGSKYLYDLFIQLGFVTGSRNKIVPTWINELDNDKMREFVYGFADADGCDRDDNTYQLTSVNENLLDNIRLIAMKSGLSVTRKWSSVCNGGYTPLCTMYFCTIKNTSRDFIPEKNYHIEKVRSITLGSKCDVYDIEVYNSIHNFIVDGIVAHNCLMEDAMLIHRVMRAPEKRVYKVDIGNIPPNEVDQYMERLINKTKKVPYMDEKTGDYNLRFSLMNMMEDIYLPVRGNDSGTSIEPLSGMEFTGIDDIEYLRNKMMAALKIPKAFLGYDEAISGKATLAAEDVRFARTIQRVQKFIVSELTKIAVIHLYAQGYKDSELVDFSLELTNPSTIFEKEKVSVWQEKVQLAKDMIEGKVQSKKWIYTNVFNMSDDDIDLVNNDVVEDAKQAYRIKQIEEEGIDPSKSFNKIKTDDSGGGSDSGGPDGEMGGGPDMGGLDKGSGGMPDEKGGPDIGGKPSPGGTPPKAAAPDKGLSERDQTGRKDASKYPFGEDPLGSMENNRKPNKTTKKHPISHKYARNSPLSMEGMENFFNTEIKSEILTENKTTLKKSFLDESNILQ